MTAVRLRDPGGQRQAQAGMTGSAAAGGVHTIKWLEQVWQMLRRDTRPRIPHRQRRLTTLMTPG